MIKFRAWDVLARKMIRELLLISYVRNEIIGKYENGSNSIPLKIREEAILMQSTGLFDKNGNEIFESDIVKTTIFFGRADESGGFYEYEKELIGIVKQLEGAWVIDTEKGAVYLWSDINENEVLGNIWENPKLLEEIKDE